jgi:hypothetical protein
LEKERQFIRPILIEDVSDEKLNNLKIAEKSRSFHIFSGTHAFAEKLNHWQIEGSRFDSLDIGHVKTGQIIGQSTVSTL